MRDATQVVNMKPPIRSATERPNSHIGTPNGNLTIIAIGDVKGIMLNQNDKELSGLFTMKLKDII